MATTTSVTRSRRAEGLHLPNHKIANAHRLLTNAKDQQPFAPRKRPLEAAARDFDPVAAKKARFTTGIAVEIPARPSFHSRCAREPADSRSLPAPPPPKPSAVTAAPNAAPTSHRPPPTNAVQTALARNKQQPTLTKHQEKVANGLKHELDRLQPNAIGTKDQGRKLRSQEATRFKSELSAYFPEYDEVIGNDPKETHLLNLETLIIITSDGAPHTSTGNSSQPRPAATTSPIRSYSDVLYSDLFDSQRIDFSFLKNNNKNNPPLASDPLPDTLFKPSHKKAERLERSIRNSEKGRAQHERDQIIRLLDGLQGPDWLRVMGVSGITESKKRRFEPAREHFIKGCEGILEKFRRWAAEEKRRRLERAEAEKRAAAAAAAAGNEGCVEEDGEEEEASEEGEGEEDFVSNRDEEDEDEDEDEKEVADSDETEVDGDVTEEDDDVADGPEAEGEPPDDDDSTDDVDASVAKQLREEALAAAAARKSRNTARVASGKPASPRAEPPPHRRPVPADEHPREFTSFFAKRYQRDAALSGNRRRGRNVLAWGQPVPDVSKADFELPAELRDEETLKSHARRRRRDKRGRS